MAKNSKKRKGSKHRPSNVTPQQSAKNKITSDENSASNPECLETDSKRLGHRQIGGTNYLFLVICVIAQMATILITWSTWNLRPLVDGTLPNLPWIADTPQFSTGWLLVASLVFVLISPKRFGMLVHLVILGVAISMDQFRCQPQILSLAFLMSACVWPTARRLCLWYLVAMWTWAGIHKFLSPDWFGQVTAYLLGDFIAGVNELGFSLSSDLCWSYKQFAFMVAITEVLTGLLAWFRPKIAAVVCVGLHFGIIVFLLPMDWNLSVIPWNIATAIVGAWLLWTADSSDQAGHSNLSTSSDAEQADRMPKRLGLPTKSWAKFAVVLMLIVPTGFYFGLVRHCFAHSLYSNNLPIGLITRIDRLEPLEAWDELRFPFPNVQKAYRDYFRLTGKLNEKLHIRETMRGLESHFYIHTGNQNIREVSEQTFLDPFTTKPLGFGNDDPRAVFALLQTETIMKKRNPRDMVYAVEFSPADFEPEMLKLLEGLPNLQQVQLKNCNVTDADLDWIPKTNRLIGVGVEGTKVTELGLMKLKEIPNLSLVDFGGKAFTREEIGEWDFKEAESEATRFREPANNK